MTRSRITRFSLLQAGFWVLAISLLMVSAPSFQAKANTKAQAKSRPPFFHNSYKKAYVRWGVQLTTRHPMDYKPIEEGKVAIGDDAVYVGGRGKIFYKIRKHDGKILKKRHFAEEFFSKPIYRDGRVYVGLSSGRFVVLDAETLKTIWAYHSGAEIINAPALSESGDAVYLVNTLGTLSALEADDGTLKWEHEEPYFKTMTIRRQARPAISGDKLYQGFSNGSFVVFHRHTGEILWRKTLSSGERFNDVTATALVHGGYVYTASFDKGVFCLDEQTGREIWHQKLKSANAPFWKGGKIYITVSEEGVYCLNPNNGAIEWYIAMPELLKGRKEGAFSDIVAYSADTVVFATSGSGLYFLDVYNKRFIDRFTPGNGITGYPSTQNGWAYTLSNGGWLYCVALGKPGSPYTPHKIER